MIRAWVAVALLAASWLLGSNFFQPASPLAWSMVLATATILLSHLPIRLPRRGWLYLSLVFVLPALWLLRFPHKAIPSLLAAGIILQIAPCPRRWPRLLGVGAIISGAILIAQSVTLLVYEVVTARCHDLPFPLTNLVGAIPRLLGVDTAIDGATVAMRGMSETVRIALTWELLFDPATICLGVGGVIMLGIVAHGGDVAAGPGSNWSRNSIRVLAVVLAWIPLRIALLLSIVLHRILRADPASLPNVADVLVNTWMHLTLLAVLTLLIIRLAVISRSVPAASVSHGTIRPPLSQRRKQKLSLLLVGAGVATLVALVLWEPVGRRGLGRVMVVERHSTWEPTTTPYGTELYGEAGSYNYAAAYAFCDQYFQMSRLLESQPIRRESLQDCDVLIIKTPTARYTEEEVLAVVEFVAGGGAVLMIGDHTNVFNMNTYLNDLSRRFGFTFRNDLLFRVGTPYRQHYRRPPTPHPLLQHLPPMDFAVSCSIDPGRSWGRMVIRNTGLWNLPPAYHESNYHPQAEYRPEMQYGAWCQLWSTSHGRGRVLGFADSTLFSNFCVFQPGKAELLLGMLEWLNHSSRLDQVAVRMLLVIAGLWIGGILLAVGLWLGWQAGGSWLCLLCAGLAAWAAASLVVNEYHGAALPLPQRREPLVQVAIDRTLSQVPLFTGAFADDPDGAGYGMLEQWIPRMGGIVISRCQLDRPVTTDALVVICPTRSVTESHRESLLRFVHAGGDLLVFDSNDLEGSTANGILQPFGLSSTHSMEQRAEEVLRWSDGEFEVSLATSCVISGGTPLAWWADTPVAAQTTFGDGTVTVIGFGSLFNDANMGFHWLPEPTPEVLERYEVLYTILRTALPTSLSNPSGPAKSK